jgi:hypothetical protein
MILTGKNRSILSTTCPNVTLCTTNLTCTDQGWNSILLRKRPATDRLSQRSKYSSPHSLISQKTHSFSITKSNPATLLNEIITGHFNNNTTPINTTFGQNVELYSLLMQVVHIETVVL